MFGKHELDKIFETPVALFSRLKYVLAHIVFWRGWELTSFQV